MALDPAKLNEAGDFKREVSRIITETRSLKPMPGLASAELPGSLEWQREKDWRVAGIPMTESHKELLRSIADAQGLAVPWVDR